MRVVPPLTGHLDMALSNYQKGYRQAGLIGDQIFPRVPVLRQRDAYYIGGKEALQRTEQTLRATGTGAAEVRFAKTTDTYFCASRALKGTIADEDREGYAGDLDAETVALLQGKILHDREYRIMQRVTNTANYPAGNTLALSGNAQWDNAASTPLANISIAQAVIAKGIAQKPNRLALGFDVAQALRTNPQLLQRFQYTVVTGMLSDAQLAQVFNVDQVIIGSTVSADPVTGLNSFDWSDFALLYYTDPNTGNAGVLGVQGEEGVVPTASSSFGKSFTWINGPQTVGGYGVVRARAADPTAKSDIIGVDWYSDEKIVMSEAGYLWTNCLASPIA